ncbi:alpha/beta hydrolase [Humisphaera borealis]|uniref:Alpha/beta hydrolase n=1 Tax=Humisphaera borealis TaxID=2807512 RepID=A0A7M2WW19_9BACT|nr:alpha/beta hydrolase [Humisphaera borealis]QOV89728.1 alpha/beta hydrolase [Humisphaera borealis]
MSIARIVGGVVVLLLALSASAAEVVFEEGIEFANPADQHLKLNLARPREVKAGEKLPAVVCIHGGGFRAGDRKGYNDLCKKLADRGYVAVTIDYRLAPKYQFPAAVHDVKAAVQWVKSNAAKYGIDPERVAALGGSAGGHLALFLGVTGDVRAFDPPDAAPNAPSPGVRCVVSYYGPSDLTKSYGKSVDAAEVLPLFLGGDVEHERARHIHASPLYWVTPRAAPMLLLHGTEDKYVNYEQALWMRDKLNAAEVPVELVTLDGAGHGFKGDDGKKAEAAAIEYLDRQLKSPAAPAAKVAAPAGKSVAR